MWPESDKITTGQVVVRLFQSEPVSEKVQSRILRAGLYIGETLISNLVNLTFNQTSADKRDRYQSAPMLLRGVDDAVSSGRIAILGTSSRTLEWITPVLYLRGHPTVPAQPGTTTPPGRPGGGSATRTVRAPDLIPGPAGKPATPGHWSASSGPTRQIRALTGHTDSVLRVVFSADGALLATTSSDKTARLWAE